MEPGGERFPNDLKILARTPLEDGRKKASKTCLSK